MAKAMPLPMPSSMLPDSFCRELPHQAWDDPYPKLHLTTASRDRNCGAKADGWIHESEIEIPSATTRKLQAKHRADSWILEMVKACEKDKDLVRARRLHIDMKVRIEEDLFVSNALIRTYCKCAALSDAHELFNRLPNRNVVSWNVLIAGYVEHGYYRQALECFRKMMEDGGVSPSAVTYACTLKACAATGSLDVGREIDAMIREKGLLEDDLVLAISLIGMYAKCGLIERACKVFSELRKRDVVSWNALIAGFVEQGQYDQTLVCFRKMRDEGISPDAPTYDCVLQACAATGSLDVGEEVHAKVHEQGLLKDDIVLGNRLIYMYAKWGMLHTACKVFHELPRRNIVSWNALISGYTKHGQADQALRCFRQLEDERIPLNDVTYVSLLQACASIPSLEVGKEIHDKVKKQGLLTKNIVLATAVVDMYAKCGELRRSRKVFDELPHRNVVTWSALIAGYVEHGLHDHAVECFRQMEGEGVSPNEVTYVCVLKACAAIRSLEIGEELHARVRQKGLLKNTDTGLGNMLIDMYAKCGALRKAHAVLNELPRRDVVSWSALIAGYVESGLGDQAVNCFKQMEDEGIAPDAVTYTCILKACACIGAHGIGEDVHAKARERGLLKDNIVLGTALINMYAKCGDLRRARGLFDELPQRDVVSWSAILAGYAQLGQVDMVLDAFRRMRADGVQPNAVTFVVLLNACSHAGLLERGEMLFHDMISLHRISPTADHFSCMVDLFGRAGALEKAKRFLLPDVAVLVAFLGACRKWGEVELGRSAFEGIVRLDRRCANAYVCMENMYASSICKGANRG